MVSEVKNTSSEWTLGASINNLNNKTMIEGEQLVKERKHKYYIVTFSNGRREKMRLFYYETGGFVCYYNGRSTTRGYQLRDAIKIEPYERKTSEVDRLRRYAKKVAQSLENSGLWGNLLPLFKAVSQTSDEWLSEYLNADWDMQHKMEKELSGVCSGMGEGNLSYYVGIKKIPFDYEDAHLEFKTYIENKMDGSWNHNWRKSYDNSASYKKCDDGVYRAWFSQEYKGCGNGHYYLAIDHEHAIFCEND